MTLDELRAEFEVRHPQLVRMTHAHIFRSFGPEERQEISQKAIVICWRWTLKMYVDGKIDHDNAWQAIKNCLYYATQHALKRRVPEGETGHRGKSRDDVYDRLNRREFGLEDFEEIHEYYSQDTPIPDQVAWRTDMPRFLATLNERQRQILHAMMDGYSTGEIAHIFGVTPGRVSQFRTRFKLLFDKFFGD